ncbi:MAG: hypothetical protein WAT70_01330, partial [Rhizobiaceae bacterium]
GQGGTRDVAAGDTPRESGVPRIRATAPLALEGKDSGEPCCADSLSRPDGRPRIRISRGGVWW